MIMNVIITNIFVFTELWDKYSSVFDGLWVATAFKGATGSCQLLPVIQHHLSNHEHWLRVLSREVSKFQHFRGVAFTGWSRSVNIILISGWELKVEIYVLFFILSVTSN
jgi:hypothetical protein